MSIRLIARELYRLQQAVASLEKRIDHSPSHQRERLKDQLRKLKAERNHMRNVLDGQKDTGTAPSRQP
jgi:hypothetical protein